jgi:plasmid stabilization system protein ParE
MIRYTPDARKDVLRLYAWQAARSEELAERFRELLKETENRIAARPKMFPPAAGGDARKCLMRFGRSVYVLYFTIDGEDQVILRVWHGREERR